MHNRAVRSKRGRNGAATVGAPNDNGAPIGNKGTGDPKRTFERYIEMAKAAASAGDTVESEKYYQYADHFLRLMKAGAR